MLHDIHVAVRRLLKTPLFTAVVLLILAVGIGANSAIFSVVHAVLLAPLPFPDAERLVGVWHVAPGLSDDLVYHAHFTYLFYRGHNRVFEDMGLFLRDTANLAGGARPEEVDATWITPSVMTVLGVSPMLGRGFVEEEGRPGSDPVVLLSHGLWMDLFGGDAAAVGGTVRVNGEVRTVVGVMPADFRFPDDVTRLWLPLVVDVDNPELGIWSYQGIARLRSGVDVSAAETELSSLVTRLPEIHPRPAAMAGVLAQGRWAAKIHPYRDDVVGDVSAVLWMIFGSVGVILLIACANVANLLLLRAESRQQELAIRTALGAGRGEVLRVQLVESAILAMVAGLIGLALAAAAVRLLMAVGTIDLPRAHEVTVNHDVFLFTLAVSSLSCLLVATVPVLRWRSLPASVLREGGRSCAGGRAQSMLRDGLVVAQLTLAVVLLTGSGLLVRSLHHLRSVDPGCDAEGVLTCRLSPPEAAYPSARETVDLYLRVVAEIAAIPGVERSGVGTSLPTNNDGILMGHSFEDFPLAEDEFVPNYSTHFVIPDFFEALGIPILRGRGIVDDDVVDSSRSVVISDGLARRLWPGESAIGKRVCPGRVSETDGWFTVVGVVGEVLLERPQAGPTEAIYYPMRELELGSGGLLFRSLSVVARSSGSPDSLRDAVRAAIWQIDPDLPVVDMLTMDEVIAEASSRAVYSMWIAVAAAAVSLLLGVVGLYGVVSYVTGRRSREIGIRMALGAHRGDVLWLVVRHGLILGAIGVLLGASVALGVTRVLAPYVFEVSTADPVSLLSVSLLLLVVAVVASFVPGVRAATVDPQETLRFE